MLLALSTRGSIHGEGGDTMSHVLVTHEKDAERYIKIGWKCTRNEKIVLKGTNKAYIECTLEWDESAGTNPIYPEGEAPGLSTWTVEKSH